MVDRLVWIDCEMTGLDLVQDAVVEIACVVTDGDLQVLGDGVDLLIRPPDAALAQMVDVVRTMHTESGLLTALGSATLTLGDAEQQVLDYVGKFVEAGKAPLCGNSIATDRAFLARDMPALDRYLHYRMVDVSSVKELVRRWYPKTYFASPKKSGGHRALGDILDSVRELRYYRQTVFVPTPGPDTATATQAAADVLTASLAGPHAG